MENKKWFKSLTIDSNIITIALVILTAWMILSIPPLDHDFTTEELCDWAYATSRNQRIVIIQMLVVSLSLISIYGRIRAKKGIGKDEKK